MSVIEQMLQRYGAATDAETAHAVREVMQEIALAGLYRGGFFNKAAFYGGTCLRIFHGLPRFSEDLDFSLLQTRREFSLVPYFKTVVEEFASFGFEVDILERKKVVSTAIVSAFLKKNSSIYDVQVTGQKLVKIKFEVDTDPPLKFATEEKLLLQPYSFYVKCFSLPDLFAGKTHALLFRQWKSRVKGRDWYDFEWYVRRGTPLNLTHFCERARQSGHLDSADLDRERFLALLQERVRSLDIDSARQDVMRFVRFPEQLAIWSQDYFLQLSTMLKFS